MKVLSILAAPLLVSASPLLAERQSTATSIDTLLKGVGKIYFGVSSERAKMPSGKPETAVHDNYGQVTNEYLMKWDQTEKSQGQFTLGPANDLVSWALSNQKSVRGHTLVWGEALPDWVKNINDRAQLTAVIQNHIKTVMVGPNGSWKGKIRSWDVVNEVIDNNGNLKNTHFYQVLGEDYIGIAFRAAREADPSAKLYINDYSLENNTYGQHIGMMKWVNKWIHQDGIPIDGIGSQTHLTSGKADAADALETALRDLSNIDSKLEVAITELDVVGSSPPVYWKAVQACYHVPRCVGVTTWNLIDAGSDNKALFNQNYDPKDAYYQIRDELRKIQK
ncbi:Endo-1,4-beta-xylanase [Ascochyta rabiei]|uniref:Endo-1,4-beta-xylanase n=1 Tax=Didymella rabiei TaxID=5454 RepID=UPI00220DD514|nr:Endo-1,4-beta-xylanase [Ascochyta rabiei]UPX13385.1 Endo-1,4-beta-xylanase [Ascochyta rabiei]